MYEDNGTAVRIAAMPGTETLDFNNCVFRGNGVNVENAAGYAVDLSQIVTVAHYRKKEETPRFLLFCVHSDI